jgi:hypothetical protein
MVSGWTRVNWENHYPGYFMNSCRETSQMDVPPGNSSRGTAVLVSVPERYAAGAGTRGRQEGRPYNSRSLRSAQSRKRVPSFVVAVTPRREFIKYPGYNNY